MSLIRLNVLAQHIERMGIVVEGGRRGLGARQPSDLQECLSAQKCSIEVLRVGHCNRELGTSSGQLMMATIKWCKCTEAQLCHSDAEPL